MADLAASGVTINRRWTEGGNLANKGFTVLDVTMVLSSMGTTTNAIPATAFGLTEVTEVHPRADDNAGTRSLYFLQPSLDGSEIYVYDPEVVTDANRGDAIDVSVTLRAIVKGIQ